MTAKAQQREYQTWKDMRQRCTNKNHKDYSLYGGRGVSVCARWNSFAVFLADMGRRPSSGHSLDRIDNSGHYEPANCRWATHLEQTRNRRACATETHCKRGHEFNPSTAYTNPAGKRECRICRQQATLRYRMRLEAPSA